MINYIITALVFAFLAFVCYVVWHLKKMMLDIKALEETTIKAYEENGELIITSPDGKMKIDEFKIKKEA
ncbi:hypothetical protein MAR621_03114 [Maribacter dokdonensis]|uniref:hypothetical protein n=1 Tax=Maribacter dokdonensis TaxID=320912 RepID=UPI001B258DCB|nr:hypothetical protein [Maribacter dokdonensis]CAG2532920.1 hypothetical protein MAR621_03114 [Maribacter dokdonensis]